MPPAARFVVGFLAIASFGGGLRAEPCGKFEVASIKLNTSGGGGGYPELTPGGRRFIATNQYMVALLMFAYDVSPLQISGIPSAFSQDRYDVEATCEQPMTKEQLPHLLQALLAERFHLAVHRASRVQPVYELVARKGGVNLRESTEPQGMGVVNGSFVFRHVTMKDLVERLSDLAALDRVVLDATRIAGIYDITLRDGTHATRDQPEPIFDALGEVG